VSSGVVSRPQEFRAVAEFLQSAVARPSGLLIEGEAGIGKTTLWLAAVAQARERGFAVISARVGQAESVLAYAAVADLLGDVDPGLFAELPDVQQVAVDRVLLRASSEGLQTDHRVVAAALASSVERLAARTPVLVAIDDVQWLDPSSQAVISFAARQFTGRIGILVTERCEPNTGNSVMWLHLATPDGLDRWSVARLRCWSTRRSCTDTASTRLACSALALEDLDVDVPIPFCASAVNALVLAWTGRLDEAQRHGRSPVALHRTRCREHMMAVTGYCTLIEIWRGNFAEAAVLAEDTMERAEQVGGSRTIALTVRAAVHAYVGRETTGPRRRRRRASDRAPAGHRDWRSGRR
jgi:AAA ATPase domain